MLTTHALFPHRLSVVHALPTMPQFATEAALTILRIDDLIKLDPPQEEPGEE